MPKKSTKSKAKQCRTSGGQPSVSVGIIMTLVVALIVAIVFAVCAVAQIKSYDNALVSARAEIFDHLITEYISKEEFNTKPSVNEATGYGISDEDGVFYVTFDYVTYELSEDRMPKYDELKHGIIYFWEDPKNDTYSHAFSYHDDYYHPGGIYNDIGVHYLRSQFEQKS